MSPDLPQPDLPRPDLPWSDLLWPGTFGTDRRWLVVERAGSVRALLPASPRRVRHAALARSNGPEPLARHLARRAYAAAATVRAPRTVVLPGTALADRLGEHVGEAVHPVVQLGPPRANRKPVVIALDGRGRVRAVAKLGVTALTAGLVRREAAALAELAWLDSPALTVPRLLALDDWQGHPLLVQSAVPTAGRHRVPGPEALVDALATLDTLPGEPPGPASYVAGLVDAVGGLAGASDRDLLGAALAAVEPGAGRLVRSHGDWSPQNVAAGPTGVVAWDWERSGWRPAGFDALHLALQARLARGPDPQSGVSLLLTAGDVLARCHDRSATDWSPEDTATLLMVELAARYLGDGQAGTGSPGSRVMDWVTPALARVTAARGAR
ncbi:phosphotransferase [Nocardioides sp. SYSU D00038]|uniref:phosphotransferase n=1 Tax=Nocardioides sp. SYSU D00038 TaxID=2812554 RepID=UPI0019675614|nr:phosphotransferase [Nocardioides sp. SYSU D00038]